MDIVSAELEALLTRAEKAFVDKNSEYQTKLAQLGKENAKRKSEITDLLNLLDTHKGIIRNPVLSKRFQNILLTTPPPSYSLPADYAKFIYYARRINEMEHPKYVLKYNTKYCETALRQLAVLYLVIKARLERDFSDEVERYKNQTADLYKTYTEMMKKAFANAESKSLTLAAQEASRAIADAKSTV